MATAKKDIANLTTGVAREAAAKLKPLTFKGKNDFYKRITDTYGDLIFDLSQSVLWSRPNAQIAFRRVLKTLYRSSLLGRYARYEKIWVIRATVNCLMEMAPRYGRTLSSAERMMLDGSFDAEGRIRQIDSYFHRLNHEDQILLILRDKYELSFEDVSACMNLPVGSLKLKRAQALKALDEMIWDHA
ncbi:MAG: hypothetical protein JNL01_11400 [Bdellovibrionales bacterium]|nr:hypothetical protein [Bdellovibrionales bacterium]